MSKTVEQKAQEYAQSHFPLDLKATYELTEYSLRDMCKEHFLAGYAAKEDEDGWIPIERFNAENGQDFLCFFDNGEVRRHFEDDFPFAEMTHAKLISPPKTT